MLVLRPLHATHTPERLYAIQQTTADTPRLRLLRRTPETQAVHTHRQQLVALQTQPHTSRLVAAQAVQNSNANDEGSSSTVDDDPSPTLGKEQQQQQQQPLSFEEVQQIAAARGLYISLKTLGPGYRIVCRDGGATGPILGATDGFVAPLFGLMHCDTLQVFTRGMKGEAAARVRKNALGLGLLLGGAVFSYGRSCGCTKAEILAINDDDAWHERLVRYYSYFGFKPVCKVGGNGFFADVPHLLVWGGEGTRMDADISETLDRWTPALRQSARSAARRSAAAAQSSFSSSSSSTKSSGGDSSSSSVKA